MTGTTIVPSFMTTKSINSINTYNQTSPPVKAISTINSTKRTNNNNNKSITTDYNQQILPQNNEISLPKPSNEPTSFHRNNNNRNYNNNISRNSNSNNSNNNESLTIKNSNNVSTSLLLKESNSMISWSDSLQELKMSLDTNKSSFQKLLLNNNHYSNQNNHNYELPDIPIITSIISNLSPFKYINNQNNMLLFTSKGDLLYYSSQKQQSNPTFNHNSNQMKYFVISKSQPLIIKISNNLNEEKMNYIDSLCQLSPNKKSSLTILSSEIELSNQWNSFINDSVNNSFECYNILKLNELNPILIKYKYILTILEIMKSRIPKFIIYLNITLQLSNNNNENKNTIQENNVNFDKMKCKCMLMCNEPLPDFVIQWKNNTTISYSLNSGKIVINTTINNEKMIWDGIIGNDLNSNEWLDANILPENMKLYLIIAQDIFQFCMNKKLLTDFTNINTPVILIDTLVINNNDLIHIFRSNNNINSNSS